jgi:hypothetical protein
LFFAGFALLSKEENKSFFEVVILFVSLKNLFLRSKTFGPNKNIMLKSTEASMKILENCMRTLRPRIYKEKVLILEKLQIVNKNRNEFGSQQDSCELKICATMKNFICSENVKSNLLSTQVSIIFSETANHVM